MYNVWHLFILCFLLPSKWCQMHVVAHENLTLESIMDSIIAPDFWLSGVKSYSAAKLWCSWYCKLEGLIISTLKNYRRDNHCWDSNLAQSLCFFKTGWVLVDQNHTVHQQYDNICWRLMQALERERMGFEPKTFWILVEASLYILSSTAFILSISEDSLQAAQCLSGYSHYPPPQPLATLSPNALSPIIQQASSVSKCIKQ